MSAYEEGKLTQYYPAKLPAYPILQLQFSLPLLKVNCEPLS